jgi:uncharacterized protein involved in exopolysaccharide biosynthesis
MSYPDGVPSQRTSSWIERPAADHDGARRPRPRVVLAVVMVLLGIAAGVGAALFMPSSHGARAEILYSISNSDQGGDPLQQDRQLLTQLVLLRSPAVLGPVAKKQGRQVEDIGRNVDASIEQDSNVIGVEAHGANDQAAMQTLQAVMDSYLALASKPSGLTQNLATQLATARQNTAQLQTRERQLTSEVLAGTATQASLNDVRAQLTAAQDWEKAIQARINEVAVSGQAGSAAQVLTPPYVMPAGVVTTPRAIAVSTGTLAGVILAGVVLAAGATPAQRREMPTTRQPGRIDAGSTPVQ